MKSIIVITCLTVTALAGTVNAQYYEPPPPYCPLCESSARAADGINRTVDRLQNLQDQRQMRDAIQQHQQYQYQYPYGYGR